MKNKALFFFALSALAALLTLLDRSFLKANDGFCLHHILGKAHCETASSSDNDEARALLSQKFTYLTKGHQSYVFVGADGQTVLKFYRFPSHMRRFSWLKHPFSYHFSKRRQQIKAYNEEKLHLTFKSYQLAYDQLREETGLLFIHLKQTQSLKQTLHIQDRLGASYFLDSDSTYFILQKKAEPIFPTLEKLLLKGDKLGAKEMIAQIVRLIATRCEKGIEDLDAILEKNYGWLEGKAIHIDVGRFVKKEVDRQELVKITKPLGHYLQERDEELYLYYIDQL
jgi:hypothetical protein